ncbi:MAG: ATP-binding protein [Massilia sp.]
MLSAVREGGILLFGAADVPALADLRRDWGAALAHTSVFADALAKARGHHFALILISVADDAHDPAALVRELHQQRRSQQTPIIVLAPRAGPDFPLAQCYEAGAVDVLPGALPRVALSSKVRHFIDAARSARERRHIEDVLEDTRARLDTTVAAAELAMWAWDLRADRVTADPTMQRLFGVSDADAENGASDTYFASIHPEDAIRNRQIIAHVISTGAPYEARLRVRDSALGRYRTLMARGQVSYDAGGQAVGMRGVVLDISREAEAEQELRDSEERYRMLFETVDEGVCIIDMLYDEAGAPCDYRFLEMNPAFVAHTGLQDALGKTILELAPGHEKRWFTIYGQVAATGEALRFVDQAKALNRWYDVYASRVGGPGSTKVAVLFSDITERMRAETELKRLAADLAEADRRKTEFLATLAHELRNPLAPLRSGLQVLRMAGGDHATVARVQDVMERQLDHMVELVDDLLDVARITRGQIELRRVSVPLADLIHAALDTSRPLIEAKRHTLSLSLPEPALALDADPTRVTQIISNLLNNAAKYTPEHGRIALSAARDGDSALITVSDDGIGIAPDQLEAVFEMFTQVGRDGKRADGGLGIGLSLVRSLAELHGGSVSAASAGAGTGSSFSLRLPLAAPTPSAMPALAADAAPATSMRVLVVDDNFDAADTLAALLDLLGHQAMVANSGAQALALLRDFAPQVVFLDIGMPGMDGYEVARAIRRERAFDAVKLVALTGWGGESDRARSRVAGFDLHLTKPGTLAAIEAILAP